MIFKKIVLISDMHLSINNSVARTDDLKATGYKKLRFVLDWAAEHNAVILQAGDLCHHPRSWELLSDLFSIFDEEVDEFYCVYGQHDTYMYSEGTRDKTTLGILATSGRVKILGDKSTGINTIKKEDLPDYHVYGCHFGQEIPEVITDKKNILVIHAPIAEAALFESHEYMGAELFLKQNKQFDIILCGDIHQKFCVENRGRYLVNAGPMLRREATAYNLKHHPGFWVWDIKGEKMNWIEIPHESAEKVLTRDHIDYEQEANLVLDEFIQSVGTDMIEDDSSFMKNLWAFLRQNNIDNEIVDCLAGIIGEGRMKDGKRE